MKNFKADDLDTPQGRLNYFIKKVFKTKVAFAHEMGMIPSDVSKYTSENGSQFVTNEKVKKLSNLGLNTNWYFNGEGEMLISDDRKLSNVSSIEPIGTVNLQVISEMTTEEKIKAREYYKNMINQINEALVDEFLEGK